MTDDIDKAPERETDPSYLRFMPGERLRKARELRGLTASQVARELHLSERYVAAIEKDDYSQLPEPPFVRGYMRRYATLVKLSGDDIVARFDESYAAQRRAPDAIGHAPNPIQLLGEVSRRRSGWSRIAATAGFVLLLAVVGGTVLWRSGGSKPAPVLSVDASAPPALSAPLQQVPAPVGSGQTVAAPAAASTDTLPSASNSLPALAAGPVIAGASSAPGH